MKPLQKLPTSPREVQSPEEGTLLLIRCTPWFGCHLLVGPMDSEAAFRESREPEPPVAAALIHILEDNNEEDGTNISIP